MRYDDPSEPLRVEFDTHQCDLAPEQIARMQDDLDTLTKAVENFPRPELHVYVARRSRSNDYVVKTTLILPGQTLVTSEHGPVVHAAYEQCVHVLLEQLKDYKDRLGQVPERQKVEKGTRQELRPTIDPDLGAVGSAVAGGDYAAFRTAMQGYEEPLRDRVGRWLERTAETDGQVGRRFTIADVVEEVFLDAFEGWDDRPKGIPPGEWLTGLIDPAVKELMRHPDDELENVRMVRTLQGVPATREET
ncbi:MAG TPA: HPF/RaiA family ribosome-associated protein [Gemmataceae bacterium]|jgi:ribosome-associated translation inhibitor RaiA